MVTAYGAHRKARLSWSQESGPETNVTVTRSVVQASSVPTSLDVSFQATAKLRKLPVHSLSCGQLS